MLATPVAASSAHGKQPLSLTLQGLIVNAGSQRYALDGGDLVQGSLFGQALSSAHVSFHLDASVQGLAVSGRGSIEVSPPDGGEGEEGNAKGNGAFTARISITGAVPAAVFPLNITSGSYSNCDPSTGSCNSEIPVLFTGVATIGARGDNPSTQIPIAVESPYWNPLGGPIVITSLDSATSPSIFLVVTYDRATIDWDGVQVQGVLGGTFGTETVTGSFGQAVNSQENLMLGNERDGGSIAFTGMSDSALDAQGRFSGTTTFSLAGSFDCSSLFQLPEGTCTATGGTSGGSFRMNGGEDTLITGTYDTVWSVPSLFTMTAVIGAVSQH